MPDAYRRAVSAARLDAAIAGHQMGATIRNTTTMGVGRCTLCGATLRVVVGEAAEGDALERCAGVGWQRRKVLG